MSDASIFKSLCLVNGVAQDTIAVADRGLQYGDGLFETMKVVNGQAEFLQQHLSRLQAGCQRLAISGLDRVLLEEEVARCCDGQDIAVLKIIITRGVGGRGYRSTGMSTPTRILRLSEAPNYKEQQQGIHVRMCVQRLSINPALAGIKHLNRLEQVLARREWDDASIFEGLMQNIDGHVIEGVMSNLFIVSQGCLITPDLTRSGVCGILRAVVLHMAARLNIEVSIKNVSLAEILAADEVFMCNSLMGIVPVTAIDKNVFALGALTQRLMNELAHE